MMYRIIRDIDGEIEACLDCKIQTELDETSNGKLMCQFCMESYGKGGDQVTKDMLAQMFNTLFNKLKDLKD
jgi:hypothetical protein